jgi:hypothetical protein
MMIQTQDQQEECGCFPEVTQFENMREKSKRKLKLINPYGLLILSLSAARSAAPAADSAIQCFKREYPI